MKKFSIQCRVLLFCSVVCFIVGFFIGIPAITVGAILAITAMIPASKLIQLQNKEKEERIKRLEDELESLKKK